MKKKEPVHIDRQKRVLVLVVIPLILDISLDTFAIFWS